MKGKAVKQDRRRVKRLYVWLVRQPDLGAAVRGLTSRSVREISHYVMQLNPGEDSVPCAVLDQLICEGFARFLKMTTPNNDTGGEA